MDTTTAASQAGVTRATIGAWCRAGIVTATKAAGRWDVDADSLARRTAARSAAAGSLVYRVDEVAEQYYGKIRTLYRVVRTDGTPAGGGLGKDIRLPYQPFPSRGHAEIHAEFLERTPAGYFVEYTTGSGMNREPRWQLRGGAHGDPGSVSRMSQVSETWTQEGTNWPVGTRIVDILVEWANRHAAGAAERIARKAEQDAVDAAETVVREARESRMAELRGAKGPLATVPQIDYILQLLARREASGEGGGFYYGPTDRAGIEEMSRIEASTYITSLKGDY